MKDGEDEQMPEIKAIGDCEVLNFWAEKILGLCLSVCFVLGFLSIDSGWHGSQLEREKKKEKIKYFFNERRESLIKYYFFVATCYSAQAQP